MAVNRAPVELAAPGQVNGTRRASTRRLCASIEATRLGWRHAAPLFNVNKTLYRRLLPAVQAVRVAAQGAAPVQLDEELVVIATGAVHVDAQRVVGKACLITFLLIDSFLIFDLKRT